MGPEESMRIQSRLGSTIAMAFDECVENPAPVEYVRNSVNRTTRWLKRCQDEMERLNSLDETINKRQLLFAINQGGTYDDIRIEHMKTISEMNLDGYAIFWTPCCRILLLTSRVILWVWERRPT